MNTTSSLTGRDLDLAVAERVFGQDRLQARIDPMNRNGEPQYYWGYPVGHDFAPEYSTSIEAAMRVVDKMRELGHEVEISGAAGWWATFEPKSFRRAACAGPSLPVVLCRAALAALETEDQ